ncbi:MAG: DUF2381 family protein [Myxococcaceae bacterium]|nr:MAG: DUF2381 family protein [Myxococcaceae bacterium]
MEKPQLAPGEAGLVLVETGALSEQPTEDLRLELAEPTGSRVLRISGVSLPALR